MDDNRPKDYLYRLSVFSRKYPGVGDLCLWAIDS